MKILITNEIVERNENGLFVVQGHEFKYHKACKYNRCKKKFYTNSRNQGYCDPECQKRHYSTRKNRQKAYEENKDLMRMLSATYKVAQQVAELFLGEKKCCECGSTDNIELHHKDCNPFNNDPRNLEWRCKRHHAEIHKTLPNINMAEVLVDIKEIKEGLPNANLIEIFNKKMNPEV